MTEWNREKVKKVLDVLKELKDFDKLPLPQSIHKEFDIPFQTSKSGNVMDYFRRYMEIQRMSVDKVEIIDGTVAHKDVVFPTSILEPTKLPKELELDNGEQPRVIYHEKEEKVFSDELTIPTTSVGRSSKESSSTSSTSSSTSP